MRIVTVKRDADNPAASLTQLAKQAAEEITRLVAAYRDRPVLLLLAGGSSFGLLHQVDTEQFAPTVTIGMFDERFSVDPKVNNYSVLLSTGFPARAMKKGCSMINTHIAEGESLEAYGGRFEANIKSWIAANPHGKVIGTFGIGDDGHTGGMMPYPENPQLFKGLFETDRWAVGYDAKGKNEYALRATCTMSFIRNFIDERVIFSVGEGKRAALGRVRTEKGSLAETPARIHRDAPNAVLFTDLEL